MLHIAYNMQPTQATEAGTQSITQSGTQTVSPENPVVVKSDGGTTIRFDGRQVFIKRPGQVTQTVAVSEFMPPVVADVAITIGAIIAIILIGRPIAKAVARWIDRRTTAQESARLLDERLARMQDEIDRVALDVERIGEVQRFNSGLLAEAGVGAGEPAVAVPENVRPMEK